MITNSHLLKLFTNVDFQHAIFNTKSGGFLGTKLKNMGVVKFKRAPNRSSTKFVCTPQDEKAKMKILMNDLKSAVVNKFEMDKIKQLLIDTSKHRDRLMLNPRTDIKETFSVFFANPELVITTFILYFFLLIH